MLRLLGGISIDGHGPVRSRAQRVILCALAVDRDSVVSTGRLADLLWGDAPPENPAGALQNHVSRLRSILPQGSTIESEGHGYRLAVETSALDVARFDHWFEQACATTVGDRLEPIEAALDLWRGEPFADVEDDRCDAERSRLLECHTTLREMRAETLISLGRAPEATADLEKLRRLDELRERTVELLMTALFRSGRKADALDTYRQLRASLVEKLGLDPSAGLQQLELAILDDRLDEPEPPTPATSGAARSMIPSTASIFVGRDRELARLGELMSTNRLVTIVGPGGVGKTRLAIQAARAAAEHMESTWVELAPLSDSSHVAGVVASAMGLQPRAGSSDEKLLIDAIGTRRHLLIVDNCEHLVEATAELAHQLLRRAPNLHMLATSREALRIDGEQILRLQPLDSDTEAVDLFVLRASAAAGELDPSDEELDLIAEICRALDGLPLAIELTASRCATAGIADLAEAIREPMALATARRRGADDRHNSLRALVEWSVRELSGPLLEVFEMASVFAGPFAAADAAEVTRLDREVVAAALTELAERSLLTVQTTTPTGTMHRYLATIRSYAAERMARRPDANQIDERYMTWSLGLAERCRSALAGPGGDAAESRLLAALEDLRVAHRRFMDAGDASRALRLAAALHFPVLMHMSPEPIAWVMEAVDRFLDREDPALEPALSAAAIASWMSGDITRAGHYAERAAEVAERSDHPRAGLGAAQALGDVAQFEGDNQAAFAHFSKGVEIARASDDRLHLLLCLGDAAAAAGYLGRFEIARSSIHQARDLLGDDGCDALRAWISYSEGEALADADPERALEALEDSLELAGAAHARFVSGVAGLTRTSLQLRTGDPVAAIAGAIDLMGLWRSSGSWVQQWITLRAAVELFVRLDDLEHAAVTLGAITGRAAATEISGPDAERLDQAMAAVVDRLSDASSRLDAGARMSPDVLVDSVMGWLGEHLTER